MTPADPEERSRGTKSGNSDRTRGVETPRCPKVPSAMKRNPDFIDKLG